MEKLIAVDTTGVPIFISPPDVGIEATTNVGTVLNNALLIIFIIAALAVLFMLIIGAFQWIMSGGDKEAVGNARKRITHALIGLAILALAFFILQVVGSILNFNILDTIKEGLPNLEGKKPPTPPTS